MAEKIIRDPVHDLIVFRTDDPTDALLFRLINAVEFQRLRRIRQLGMASLTYPGADHSRYAHSIGVMETARKILARLSTQADITPYDARAYLCAALLHDLGHGPFSHVFERVTGVNHELLTARVVLDPESEIHQLLIQADTSLPEDVVAIIQKKYRVRFLCDAISSQLDADRLDYLLRDDHMTGAGYGGFDLKWLIQALTVDPQSQRLVVLPKAVSAVEAYLQARYHMYRNVYFHKVVRSAEGMLKLALKRARRLAVQDRLDWPLRDSAVNTALAGQRLSMKQFVELDDVSLVQCFKTWADGSDRTLARLCKGLLFRRVYKSIDVTGWGESTFEIAKKTIEDLGGDAEYDLFYDEPKDTPYPIDTDASDPAKPQLGKGIFVITPNGLENLARLSPMIESLNRQLMFRRIHCTEEYRDAIATAVFGVRR
jgi:uncharacterized protein